jgi:uncharacterized protein (DUF433 family)
MLNDWEDRIIVDSKILVGKPVIKGTRLSVEFILGLLANGWSVEQVLDEYPQLKREDVIASLKYGVEKEDTGFAIKIEKIRQLLRLAVSALLLL